VPRRALSKKEKNHMARRRHHRRHRGFRGYVSVPGFGDLKQLNPLGKHVNSNGVLLGAVAGMAVGAGVKYLVNKLNASMGGKIPTAIMNYIAPISTFLGGVALYFASKKFMKGKGILGFGPANAQAVLVGATAAAVTPIAWKLLGDFGPKMADGTPFFSDYVTVASRGYGLIQADRQFGLITTDGPMKQLSGYGAADEWDPMSVP
jgi:hypothetical protein